MKQFEVRIAFSPELEGLPHSLSWSSMVDVPYPLVNMFDSLMYRLPTFNLAFLKDRKVKIAFWLGNPYPEKQQFLGQRPEEPNYPPMDPPYEPHPEKPTIIPEEEPFETPSEEPRPIPPDFPNKPDSLLELFSEVF